MKRIAIVDIDDVLADSTPRMIEELNRRLAATFHIEDMKTYYLWESFPVLKEMVVEVTEDEKLQETFEPLDGAAEVLARLRKNGYFVWLITGRLEHLRTVTEGWLKRWRFVYDKLTMNIAGPEKATIIAGNADLAFEDRHDTAVALSKVTKIVYLFVKPWNQGVPVLDNVFKVHSWREVGIPSSTSKP